MHSVQPGKHGALFLALQFGWLALLHAAEPGVKSPPLPAAPAPAANPSVNSVTQAAVQGGVLTCAGRINQVASFLTAGSQSSAYLFTSAREPDQRIFSTSLEISGPGAPVAYASASFAPNQANGCGALYETVTYWPLRCEEVGARQFTGLQASARLGSTLTVLQSGTVRVFLMPADKGCVAIKKEILQ